MDNGAESHGAKKQDDVSPPSPFIHPRKDNPRHCAFVRLVVAARDWRAALAALQYILKNIKGRQDPLYLPLTTAAVICYARAFLGGRSHGRIPGSYEKFPYEAFLTTHKTVIRYRNEVVAHSNENRCTVTLWPKGTVIETNEGKTKFTLANHGEHVQSPELAFESVPSVEALVSFQHTRLKEEIDRQKEELFPSA
jgi:hypothetical protein